VHETYIINKDCDKIPLTQHIWFR